MKIHTFRTHYWLSPNSLRSQDGGDPLHAPSFWQMRSMDVLAVSLNPVLHWYVALPPTVVLVTLTISPFKGSGRMPQSGAENQTKWFSILHETWNISGWCCQQSRSTLGHYQRSAVMACENRVILIFTYLLGVPSSRPRGGAVSLVMKIMQKVLATWSLTECARLITSTALHNPQLQGLIGSSAACSFVCLKFQTPVIYYSGALHNFL